MAHHAPGSQATARTRSRRRAAATHRDEKKYFHRKRTQKRRWQDQLQTTTIYRLAPDAELTDIQNSILWTTHSFNSAGQRPYRGSIATLLRLDVRTVVKHIEWFQEKGFLDADMCVVADPRHWLDAAPKVSGEPDVRWEEFAAEWVASRYDCGGKPYFALSYAHFRRSLRHSCEEMAQAGYASVKIRDYWEREVPGAYANDRDSVRLLLMEYFVERVFHRMFPAVEQITTRNRQTGKFHGCDSLGLLRQVTSSTVRTMKARLVEGGVEALELWCPDFSSLGATARRPETADVANRTSVRTTMACGYPVRKLPCDREGFAKMFIRDAPELDCENWLERILTSPRYKEEPEETYLACGGGPERPPRAARKKPRTAAGRAEREGVKSETRTRRKAGGMTARRARPLRNRPQEFPAIISEFTGIGFSRPVRHPRPPVHCLAVADKPRSAARRSPGCPCASIPPFRPGSAGRR